MSDLFTTNQAKTISVIIIVVMKMWPEFLFYLHILLIMCAILLGFFLPPLYMLAFILLHELHVWIFGGCLLTQYQKGLGGIPKKMDFFQYFMKRMFKVKINRIQAKVLNYSLLSIGLLISLIHFSF
jgi:hypothetical protein